MQTLERDADKEASGPLAIIQAVINTRYSRTRPDEWNSPEQVRAWLIHRQLLARETPLSQGDQRRMIEVREALRGLLRGNNGMSVAPETIEALNHLAKHAPLVVHFRQDGQAELAPDIEEFTLAYCDHPSQRPVSHSISSDKSHLLSSYPPHSGFACDETLTLFALSEEPFIFFPL